MHSCYCFAQVGQQLKWSTITNRMKLDAKTELDSLIRQDRQPQQQNILQQVCHNGDDEQGDR